MHSFNSYVDYTERKIKTKEKVINKIIVVGVVGGVEILEISTLALFDKAFFEIFDLKPLGTNIRKSVEIFTADGLHVEECGQKYVMMWNLMLKLKYRLCSSC